MQRLTSGENHLIDIGDDGSVTECMQRLARYNGKNLFLQVCERHNMPCGRTDGPEVDDEIGILFSHIDTPVSECAARRS